MNNIKMKKKKKHKTVTNIAAAAAAAKDNNWLDMQCVHALVYKYFAHITKPSNFFFINIYL